ncbi:MAG: hypothetical protein UW52_C0068G0012 [Candidatus Gottesmanbacteria bacterium GW2011_GWA1_44_24b]|uniref:Uncharacterized protein n=2 Tax=Candidatus Gottesmaniibacteriota TaxID=1752720 RepID=A0A0G1IDA9_9BACT|nr:MAG: hypothetical protein UW52_C0068G0012 [Candidatus Gottesmanbacteria bacterium GW2011_GWA1_44_24b]
MLFFNAVRLSDKEFKRKGAWRMESRYKGFIFGVILIVSLAALEIFNYSVTEYALFDLNLHIAGIQGATILAIIFCSIDFVIVAYMFIPSNIKPEAVWYIFGAWLLLATMHAGVIWWGISLAMLENQTLGNTIIDQETLVRVVPVAIAVFVWLLRVLIMGTFAVAGEKLLSIQTRSVQPR